jgi:hypothetical protein
MHPNAFKSGGKKRGFYDGGDTPINYGSVSNFLAALCSRKRQGLVKLY